MSAGYSSRRLRSENDLPRPFPVRLALFILKLIAFTPVPLARPIGAPATTLRWHLGAQAPVRGRSQLSPTGAFNTAASSATPAAWRDWPRCGRLGSRQRLHGLDGHYRGPSHHRIHGAPQEHENAPSPCVRTATRLAMTLPAKAMSRPFSFVAEKMPSKVALLNRTFDGGGTDEDAGTKRCLTCPSG